MTMQVHAGNRLEILVDELVGILRRPSGSPLVPEIVVVQSRGMQRCAGLGSVIDILIAIMLQFFYSNHHAAKIDNLRCGSLAPLKTNSQPTGNRGIKNLKNMGLMAPE